MVVLTIEFDICVTIEFCTPMEKSIEKAIHFLIRWIIALYPKNPTKSKIVISSEIGITCDELGCFIAIHSAIKFDVKHRTKEYGKIKNIIAAV
jgi:hypothetical protein